jgi:hypothetical protein
MPTTEATSYFLGYVGPGGHVTSVDRLEATEPMPRHWGVRLHRFWPANCPGERNNPWNEGSSVGRDRGAVSLRVTPLLRQSDDLEASGVAVFDVATHSATPGFFPAVELDALLPAKVRGTDGLQIQADLVDVSLFLTPDKIGDQAGKAMAEGGHRWQRLDSVLLETFPVAIFADLGGRLVQYLWYSVIQPTGIDARAWNPSSARFTLRGTSFGPGPQARPGRYVLAGAWQPHDWTGARYSEAHGLRLAGSSDRVAANVLEFELLGLREEGEG